MSSNTSDFRKNYPLVILHSYWKWPFIVDFPIKMVIFHSYVKLPEGNPLLTTVLNTVSCHPQIPSAPQHQHWNQVQLNVNIPPHPTSTPPHIILKGIFAFKT
jgi:hypothetical protein